MMNHQPLIADEFKEVRGQYLSLLRFVRLLGGQILDAEDPGDVARHLYHHIAELKLHGKRIIEDQDPGVADSGPPRTQRPTGVDTRDVFLVHPHLVHLGDVEAFKRLIELLIGFRDGFDPLFQHAAPLSQRSGIIL